jgi:hypothetical protein
VGSGGNEKKTDQNIKRLYLNGKGFYKKKQNNIQRPI